MANFSNFQFAKNFYQNLSSICARLRMSDDNMYTTHMQPLYFTYNFESKRHIETFLTDLENRKEELK